MIYMHNRVVTINTFGKGPELTKEFYEALGRAVMWGMPEQGAANTDTIDSVKIFFQSKDALAVFYDWLCESKEYNGYITPKLFTAINNALSPIEGTRRLTMGIVQHNDGTWGLHT